MEIHQLTAHELLEKLKSKETTQEEILASLKKRIEDVEVKVKAFVRVEKPAHPHTRAPADSYCLPIAVKDNICIQGQLTSCASKILEGFRPPYDATVIRKLKEAGCGIYGQTNMDEFAFGSSCENSCYFPTRNPWNLACVPGGSSGGSASAVAADEAFWALGSDTGGSIRQPASFCGVVGLKPTYGRVSRYGLIAFASSLDQIGPITKDVQDSALLLKLIAGHDRCDATSVNTGVPDYTQSLGKDIRGLKIGVPKEYFALSKENQLTGIDPEVKQCVEEAILQLKKLGAQVKEVSLPHSAYAVPVYYIIATAEASSNLERFDGVQYGLRHKGAVSLHDMYEKTRDSGFGYEAKRRIILGTYVLSHGYYEAYYLRALKVRALIANDFANVFKECDCIVTPTSPTPAFAIGEKTQNPLAMYLSDIYTISVNLAGIPAISVPCGLSKAGLPVGLQIIAKAFDEEMLLKVAHAYEQSTPWHKEKPKI
ncbi:MAG: aspartyl/glutamyl-tRNA amidotransferase subunit A [Omnitrophica WOR_2 bacterium GWF2_43_52]|nr:MAG: aspartyl/glutamyl-tRNA amidotransferase subunit A [Omnitrophica WOR_2 bacterium GWF2_43_52]OGX56819.1 MAG: aspartyl/glutamyl-tRNA amidotransferase subunit A [Omnitrophica WOR_2 bacterium RIFOXYC2_FULL_43_9]HAH21157.1 Asp-tRNA(Asn)/Glu-tRNA(Gln) amidotransferase GatCAB subunit A [Candidatus Omnitrophota bacterium]HBG63241.1 Asp-tRNA(Asn)/Glu-tRNA(Gln) amidotransferase GatCAB subunit A [Candidatus Omnitrophota bacterium]